MPPEESTALFSVYNPDGDDRKLSDPLELLPAPKWRRFKGQVPEVPRTIQDEDREAGYRFVVPPFTAQLVNTALLLRRPLLVTGNPGTGKSTLPYNVSRKLGLGTVLRWNITSRSTLQDGLYKYDALRRLNDASLLRKTNRTSEPPPIDNYITLGPLGTALLPSVRPRVLLIDELDKSDIDLPNDLLHVFEEGKFEVQELRRELNARKAVVGHVFACDGKEPVPTDGNIECSAFPFVVLTSNAEREFPPAFLRRCIRLHMSDPGPEELKDIARTHLADLDPNLLKDLVERFVTNRGTGVLANDQLLNALYVTSGVSLQELNEAQRKKVVDLLITPLNRTGSA